MKKIVILVLILFYTSSYACSCECTGDCSFSASAYTNSLVALVKVISFHGEIEGDILGYDGDMPLSMTVEIIKKYKGKETRKRIKIWGDNGMLCRPYLGSFERGGYYLIAPSLLGEYHNEGESATDYDFFACSTDYLSVDMEKGYAYGKYSRWKRKISLDKFEKVFKK